MQEILEQSADFFVEQAKTIYHPYYLEIDEEEVHPSLRDSCEFQGEKPLEFMRVSESELRRLTQLAAFTLAELKPLFEQYSVFEVIYQSTYCYSGCFTAINIRERYDEIAISDQAKQLFDLIFDYNFFIGGTLAPKYGGPGFNGYEIFPYRIAVEVQAPSQHERLEASLELQSWLSGKLTEEEIKSYFEGTYALDPPNPLKRWQIDDDIPEF